MEWVEEPACMPLGQSPVWGQGVNWRVSEGGALCWGLAPTEQHPGATCFFTSRMTIPRAMTLCERLKVTGEVRA